MSNKRRGCVLLIRGGDPQICDALEQGVAAGLGETVEIVRKPATPRDTEADPARLEADMVAQAWIDGQRLKRAVHNRKTPEDYALLAVRAEGTYSVRPMGAVRRRLWALIGMVVLATAAFFAWEEACWRGEWRM